MLKLQAIPGIHHANYCYLNSLAGHLIVEELFAVISDFHICSQEFAYCEFIFQRGSMRYLGALMVLMFSLYGSVVSASPSCKELTKGNAWGERFKENGRGIPKEFIFVYRFRGEGGNHNKLVIVTRDDVRVGTNVQDLARLYELFEKRAFTEEMAKFSDVGRFMANIFYESIRVAAKTLRMLQILKPQNSTERNITAEGLIEKLLQFSKEERLIERKEHELETVEVNIGGYKLNGIEVLKILRQEEGQLTIFNSSNVNLDAKYKRPFKENLKVIIKIGINIAQMVSVAKLGMSGSLESTVGQIIFLSAVCANMFISTASEYSEQRVLNWRNNIIKAMDSQEVGDGSQMIVVVPESQFKQMNTAISVSNQFMQVPFENIGLSAKQQTIGELMNLLGRVSKSIAQD